MSRLHSLLGRVALLAALSGSTERLLAQCGLDPNVGPNLNLTDDSLSSAQPLGFSFPFAGANYDTVYVSSNGFLYLFDSNGSVAPPTLSRCCNGTTAGLLASTSPMVCAMWQDLNPTAGGSVHFQAVSSSRALVTWMGVPEYGQTNTITMQIALHATGQIDVFLDAANTNATHTPLTGWSPGNGAQDPGSSDLSSMPLAPGSATVYEIFAVGTFDLGGVTFSAIPSGPTSWVVVPTTGCAFTSPVGLGCPKPCDTFEEFPQSTFDLAPGGLTFTALPDGSYRIAQCTSGCFDTNFANNLGLGDDALATGMNLGFTFPFCGGSTTSVDVCSNGFVWLVSGSTTSADFSPTADEFLNGPARIAALWMDLDARTTGGVYFDALPGKALVTWNQVPAFGMSGSSNTFQLQLFPNGDFTVTWTNALNNQTTGNGVGLTGYTQSGTVHGNRIDLSASIPYVTGNGRPLVLRNQLGSQPVLGTTFQLEIADIRAGTVGGSLSLGATNPNLDLGFLGLVGCRLHASLDVSVPFAPVPPVTSLPLRIPNVNALVGRGLEAQAVLVDPSLGRAIPVYLSNGAHLTFGR